MEKKIRILLTNDDGIQAPGLQSLWKSLHEANIADLIIIAPATERSGTGVSITWDRPIQIRKFDWPSTPAWSVDGTPADCVKMASKIILESVPDFIISGINAGSNAGRNVLHSGTVGAVIEGVLRGIPGIAFSCENGSKPNYHVAEKYIPSVVRYCLTYPLPAGSFLNVNIPHAAQDKVRGFVLTRHGKGRWTEDPSLHLESESGPSYWLGGKPEELTEEADCDINLLREGYLTAVPVHVYELTDFEELKKRRQTFSEFLSSSCEKLDSALK